MDNNENLSENKPRPQNFSLTDKFMREFCYEAGFLEFLPKNNRNMFIKTLFNYYLTNKKNMRFIKELKKSVPK